MARILNITLWTADPDYHRQRHRRGYRIARIPIHQIVLQLPHMGEGGQEDNESVRKSKAGGPAL